MPSTRMRRRFYLSVGVATLTFGDSTAVEGTGLEILKYRGRSTRVYKGFAYGHAVFHASRYPQNCNLL